ncbi:MAG: hypothetical protein FWD05_11980 [Oscillospiraceae bacterium]|nr:hypothetical protein [Oscillospiraceae bacterium]
MLPPSKTKKINSVPIADTEFIFLAGLAGFEPTNARVKVPGISLIPILANVTQST